MVEHADLHCMEEIGLSEVVHNTRSMWKLCLIVDEHGATRVQHRLAWCQHRWACYKCCDLATGIACQWGHSFQVCSLDNGTKNRHAAQDDIGHYTLGTLQAMLLKPVCNHWSCHLHRERWNTQCQHGAFANRWEAAVSDGVFCSVPLDLFATAQPVTFEQYYGSWLELAGERPLWCYALRADASAKWKLVWKPHAILPFTAGNLTRSAKYF